MDHAASVAVRELARAEGGQWHLTTIIPEAWGLTCPARELWVGNAKVQLPKTGLGRDVRVPGADDMGPTEVRFAGQAIAL